jgi:glycosyltransferase involved in cell wall biosynthesis
MNKIEGIAIVIPARNEEVLLENCLNSVSNSIRKFRIPIPVKLHVTDNGSSDRTLHIIQNYKEKNFSYSTENKMGVGNARKKGFQTIISQMKGEINLTDLWILSLDADSIVPDDWLINWYKEMKERDSLFLGGNANFGPEFKKNWNNSFETLEVIKNIINYIELKVGKINIDGYNNAISAQLYSEIGPFTQAYTNEAHPMPKPGEDWSLSYEAFRQNKNPALTLLTELEVSPRRFISNPIGYFDGKSYEKSHLRVDSYSTGKDPVNNSHQFVKIYLEKYLSHYLIKPLLAKPSLIGLSNVKELIEKQELNYIYSQINYHLSPFEKLDGVTDYWKAVDLSFKICSPISKNLSQNLIEKFNESSTA